MQNRDQEEALLKQYLTQCAIGDKVAFNSLYSATSQKFYAIILRMVKNPDLTHDILQKAYLSIWKNSDSFDPSKGKAFTWMLVVMRNRAIDVLREKSRLVYTDCLDETIEDEGPRSDQTARALLLRRKLVPHMKSLPSHVSKAISMNVIYGYSMREIAEQSNVSVNTAKSWIRRGLSTLRNDMDAESFEALM